MSHKVPELVQAIVSAVLGTALADGTIQPEEREVLRAVAEQFDLEEGELIEAVEARPRPVVPDPGALGSLERVALMRYAVLAAQADGSISRKEVGFLKDLGERLGMSRSEWEELEEFSAELYHACHGGPVSAGKVKAVLERYLG
ncbi:MAG: TerB family tellurite resistance protein [Candidatus Wallbacteria bacterium]|nr:TerB family tellurite resistance protein [Candidatus Wallbacteria bacterium]